jgi:hypothetical protein
MLVQHFSVIASPHDPRKYPFHTPSSNDVTCRRSVSASAASCKFSAGSNSRPFWPRAADAAKERRNLPMAAVCRAGWGHRCIRHGSARHTLDRKLRQAMLILFFGILNPHNLKIFNRRADSLVLVSPRWPARLRTAFPSAVWMLIR